MEFGIQNVGPIKECLLKFNRLTVLCGKNNSGKTYYTYSLCAFLEYLRSKNPYVFTPEERKLFSETGKLSVKIEKIVETFSSIFTNGYMSKFPVFLAKSLAIEDRATESCIVEATSEMGIQKGISNLIESESAQVEMVHPSGNKVVVFHMQGSDEIICSYVPQASLEEDSSSRWYPLDDSIFRGVEWMFMMLIRKHLPRCFCITSERSGVYMFGSELRFFNSILANASVKDFAKYQSLRKRFDFRGYPLPVRQEIEVVLRLDEIKRNNSIFNVEDGTIIKCLDDLLGGKYDVDQSGISFTDAEEIESNGMKSKKIGLTRCSSSVRSLAELNYYVRHIARENDILVIDEPELDLHPKLQRKFARLIARLVNRGLQVFLTTHSDYLLREINLLSCAWSEDSAIRSKTATNLGIDEEALLSPCAISCYVMNPFGAKPMSFENGKGFPVESFDDNIREFTDLYLKLHEGILGSTSRVEEEA